RSCLFSTYDVSSWVPGESDMTHATYPPPNGADRGIASLLLLFAMSAFCVLGVAALTTGFGAAPPGASVGILHGVPDGSLTKFVAPLVIRNVWRVRGSNGSFAFELPVLVPENGGQPSGSTAAWHA